MSQRWEAEVVRARLDLARDQSDAKQSDNVDHPTHYLGHPSGVECIAVTEHMNFCLGNAIKYIWRAGLKGEALEDLEKAAWYVNREIARLKSVSVTTTATDGV